MKDFNTIKTPKFLTKIFAFFENRKLQWDIISSFIILFASENIITLTYTYKSNEKVSMQFAEQSMSQYMSSVKSKTEQYLNDVEKIVNLFRSLIDLKDPKAIQDKKLKNCLMESIRLYPHFDNIYIGLTNGNYLGIEQMKARTKYITQSDKFVSENVKYFIQMQDRSEGKGKEYYTYYTTLAEPIFEEVNDILNFDPRSRPWFSTAEEKGDFVWTSVYVFSGTNNFGISASVPVYIDNENLKTFAGVIGVDLLLEDLSVFMRKQNISKNSSAVIVDENGQVIAYQGVTKEGSDSKTKRLLSTNELEEKQINVAFQNYKSKKENNFSFEVDQTDYIASFQKLKNNELDWIIGVVVPKSDFSKAIEEMQFLEIITIIFVSLISIIITFYLSKRISYPIMQIAEATQKLRDFSILNEISIKSNIFEIHMMIEALEAMRVSLISFGKFVPKILVKKLMQKGVEIKLGGKKTELTMLFSDIENFTSISENMPADKIAHHLSNYFTELSNIMTELNGTIDKYVGDGIIAFWNAPNSDKNHMSDACHAALLCQKRLSELNREWELNKLPKLKTRIGIHSAEVIVGNIGSDEKMNYTIIGDGVNLAARLEPTNKIYKTSILISEHMYKYIYEKFLLRPIDVVTVKGKTEPVKIYELVGQFKGDSRILPSEENVKLCEEFTKAFNLYTEQRWVEAIKALEKIASVFTSDYPTQILLDRCKSLKENPPKKGWDGVFAITIK